jgi:hypothetical protein
MSSGPQCWRAQYKSYSVGTLLLPMPCRCRTRAKVYSAEAGFQRRLPAPDTVLLDSVCLVAKWHLTQTICLCAIEFVAIWGRKVGRMEGSHGWSPCRRRTRSCSQEAPATTDCPACKWAGVERSWILMLGTAQSPVTRRQMVRNQFKALKTMTQRCVCVQEKFDV